MPSTGSVNILDRFKGERGNTMVVGTVKVGAQAQLDAGDFELSTIESIVFTPSGGDPLRHAVVQGSIGSNAGKEYNRGWVSMTGSIGSQTGQVDNYVKTITMGIFTRGSLTVKGAGDIGSRSLYIGTQAGSFTANFLALGY